MSIKRDAELKELAGKIRRVQAELGWKPTIEEALLLAEMGRDPVRLRAALEQFDERPSMADLANVYFAGTRQ